MLRFSDVPEVLSSQSGLPARRSGGGVGGIGGGRDLHPNRASSRKKPVGVADLTSPVPPLLRDHRCPRQASRYGQGVTIFLVDASPLIGNFLPKQLRDRLLPEQFVRWRRYSGQSHHGAIMAAKLLEVAPHARIQPIVVPDETGSFDFARAALMIARRRKGLERAVMLYPMTGVRGHDHSAIVEEFTRLVISSGATLVFALPNDNRDSCGTSPSMVPDAISVSRLYGLPHQIPVGKCISFYSNQWLQHTGTPRSFPLLKLPALLTEQPQPFTLSLLQLAAVMTQASPLL
eukprot:NODE_1343_length_1577_cov_31.373691_g1207_i0.p1 GENE.NODE_1343_length_1577_cov_31.373691_g1207_i0~~NODE_1343_length_1577_cov_31.373691_g1207_i0.p1  ORF type:complete len:289 (+),score=28.93 NODE_1343_length_1577_cov_31.373691_g1207_i0:398-1264(+)